MADNWRRKRALLSHLMGGDFISGEWLAQQLGISRAAVAKHMSSLEQYGIDFYSVKGRGYKLVTPVHLVDESQLVEASNHRCFYFNELDSSNEFLLNHAPDLCSGDFCITEYQSAGRGRRGRRWQSPYGSHLYFSLYWRFPQGMAQAMGLSLVVACSLQRVLTDMGVADIGLKWPNDIYHEGKKLAGVLIEMSGQADSECHLVIGIGINLSMPQSHAGLIEQPWSDLSQAGINLDKTLLAQSLQQRIVDDVTVFEREGLTPFRQRWADADLFFGRPVSLHFGNSEVTGICRGIDESGAVLLDANGTVTAYVGGEISLRKPI